MSPIEKFLSIFCALEFLAIMILIHTHNLTVQTLLNKIMSRDFYNYAATKKELKEEPKARMDTSDGIRVDTNVNPDINTLNDFIGQRI